MSMHSVFGMYNRDKGEELSFIIRGMSFDDDYLRDCYLSMATNDGTWPLDAVKTTPIWVTMACATAARAATLMRARSNFWSAFAERKRH